MPHLHTLMLAMAQSIYAEVQAYDARDIGGAINVPPLKAFILTMETSTSDAGIWALKKGLPTSQIP